MTAQLEKASVVLANAARLERDRSASADGLFTALRTLDSIGLSIPDGRRSADFLETRRRQMFPWGRFLRLLHSSIDERFPSEPPPLLSIPPVQRGADPAPREAYEQAVRENHVRSERARFQVAVRDFHGGVIWRLGFYIREYFERTGPEREALRQVLSDEDVSSDDRAQLLAVLD